MSDNLFGVLLILVCVLLVGTCQYHCRENRRIDLIERGCPQAQETTP